MEFPSILKELRESRNLDQKDIAKILHVSRSTVASYETGRREPDYDKLVVLSNYFGVSVDYLLTGIVPVEFTPMEPTPEMEARLDRRVLSVYKKLSYDSKKQALAYMEFLEQK